jgi:hypothetical protein
MSPRRASVIIAAFLIAYFVAKPHIERSWHINQVTRSPFSASVRDAVSSDAYPFLRLRHDAAYRPISMWFRLAVAP